MRGVKEDARLFGIERNRRISGAVTVASGALGCDGWGEAHFMANKGKVEEERAAGKQWWKKDGEASPSVTALIVKTLANSVGTAPRIVVR